MIPDSTNVRVIADNIRKLKTEVENAVELPSVQTTDEGKVLTVNSSGKWAALDPASQLPAVTSSDEGSLLTVNSSGEWAKGNPIIGNIDYSETEQNTGLKWIDGKDVYMKALSGSIPSLTENTTIEIDNVYNNIIFANGIVCESTGIEYAIPFYSTANLVSYIINSNVNKLGIRLSPNFSNGNYKLVVFYTKPTATRDEEPETKKSTKRKTTKGEN